MRVVLRQATLIAVKDTRIFFKDKFAVGFAFLFPFLFVIGFSLALGGQGPEDEPLQLVLTTHEGADGVSAQIIQGFADEGGAGDLTVMPYDEALAATEDGELAGFVAFPPRFGQSLMGGVPTRLDVVVGDGSPETQAALQGFAQSIGSQVWQGFVGEGAVSSVLRKIACHRRALDDSPARHGPLEEIAVALRVEG
ncbi:MAG: hypothetical protein OXC95_00175, partial [Dehalococcoidia bacterium]|nr:hypothetical protein [Dehalococcoidia bacterium]